MKLYKETEKPLPWRPSVQVRAKELATLDDLKAALAEHGLVAVPVDPTEAMLNAGGLAAAYSGSPNDDQGISQTYRAMIQAAEEKQ